MMTTSMAGQAVQSGLSTATVDASVAKRVVEGQMVEDVSTMRAVGDVQSDATLSIRIVMPVAVGAWVGPSAAESAVSAVQQVGRSSEEEGSTSRTRSKVERAEGDASAASLGAMVTA
jgi:hypothetical protein